MRFQGVFLGSLEILKSCRIIGGWFGALNLLIPLVFAAGPPKRLYQSTKDSRTTQRPPERGINGTISIFPFYILILPILREALGYKSALKAKALYI